MRYQPRPFVRRLVLLLAGLMLLTLAIHLAAIYLLRYEIEQALDPQPGRGTYIGKLELNLFTGNAVIGDIELGSEDHPYFALSQLALDLDMRALVEGRLVISRIDALRGFWRVERRADGRFDIGFPTLVGQRSAPKKSGGAAIPLLIRHAQIDRFNILYSDRQALTGPQTLRIRRFTLDDLALPAGRPARFQARLGWGDARLDGSGAVSLAGSPALQADVQVDKLPLGKLAKLARQPQPLDGTLSTQVSLDYAAGGLKVIGARLALQDFTYTRDANRIRLNKLASKGAWTVDLGNRTFSLDKLQLALTGLRLQQAADRLRIDRADLQLSARQSGFGDPRITGAARIDGVRAAARALNGADLGIAWVSLDGIRVAGKALDIGALAARKLALSNGRLALASLRLGSSHIGARRIALGEARLSGLDVHVERDTAGQWHLPVAVAGRQAKRSSALVASGKPAATRPPGAAAATPTVSLAGVRFQGDNRIHLDDRSVTPPLRVDLAIARLNVGAMDSAEPRRDTPLDLLLQPDRYTALQLKGQLRPFSPTLYLDLGGALSDLELKVLNGLVADGLGNRFLGGHINDTFKLKIANDNLDMHNALHLRDVDVEAIPGKNGLPLSTAVALLSNANGAIDLHVPISGNLDDPNFHVLAALNPIILKAVAGAAALAFQPVGSVLLVGGLLADQALKVSFAPALFQPRTDKLAKGQVAQVQDLATKLKSKPKLHLRLCGVAVALDRGDNKADGRDQTRQQNNPDVKKPSPGLSDTQMLKLAERRAAVVRRLMLDKGVKPAQLRLCRPEIDPAKDARPRVDIKL